MPETAEHEQYRLSRLRETELLDSPAEAVFDDTVALAAKICCTPVAFVSLIDEHRQWFKSAHGFEPKETPREHSFCTHALEQKDVLVVEDAEKDPRFSSSPLVKGEMGIRFYVGVPLEVEDGVALGTLAVIDRTPRTLSEEQINILKLLARQLITEIRLRLQVRAYEQDVAQRKELLFQLRERFKERSALYAISRILRDDTTDVAQVLEAVIAEIPAALQFSDRSAARIVHGATDVRSENYAPGVAAIGIDFPTDDGPGGRLELTLLNSPDSATAAGFLNEEHEWAQSLADLLQNYFDRRIVRDALAASEERFRNLLQHIPNVAVQGYGSDGIVNYWNDAAEKFYGYTAAEAIGRPMTELIIPPELQDEFHAHAQRLAIHDEVVPSGELTLMRKDGSRINVYSSHGVVRRTGHPPEFFCIDVDLSEVKRLEKQFLRVQRMEGIGTLAGGIAHDLNNLLSPIVIGVELLRKFISDSRANPVIDNIDQSARRGKDLVQQVLSFARGVEGARMVMEIPPVLREIQSIAVNTFPKNIQFQVDVDEGVWVIVGDPTQLSQVLLNLCVNARDAMPDGGRLSITVHNRNIDEQYALMDPDATAGRYVMIEVADQGVGMSKDIMERAFDPFFTTKEVGQGTGLGLSTTLGIIRSHGGFVNIHSEVGKGTVVKIHLPAAGESP